MEVKDWLPGNRGDRRETSGVDLVLVGGSPLAGGAYLTGLDTGYLVIDAAQMTFACPLDLAGIVATGHWAAGASLQVALVMPSNQDTAAYLQRMDVVRQMPQRTRVIGDVPIDARSDHSKTLIEVTPLNAGNVGDLSERLGPVIRAYYGHNDSAASGAVVRACGELMANATEHGGSQRGAFIAAQVYTGRTTGASRFEFAVCDTGIGILSHLRLNPHNDYIVSDEMAIAEAMKPGISGVNAVDRGNGLSDAIHDTVQFGRVDFQFRSGKGEVRVIGSQERRHQSPRTRLDYTTGTWAWFSHRPQPEGATMLQSGQ